jgi:hypothetical protein
MRLDRVWIVRDRDDLTETVEELVFTTILRGRAEDAVNLCLVICGCEPHTWDKEHWEWFSTPDEAMEEAKRRWDAFDPQKTV